MAEIENNYIEKYFQYGVDPIPSWFSDILEEGKFAKYLNENEFVIILFRKPSIFWKDHGVPPPSKDLRSVEQTVGVCDYICSLKNTNEVVLLTDFQFEKIFKKCAQYDEIP